MSIKVNKSDALRYHQEKQPGKIEVVATKPLTTQYDLSLAYSPGVAEPSKAIAAQDDLVFQYTAKGNLVAVLSNGTAVLGLGNVGPHAAKPVMEGKAVLFKKFAGIDAFDIELNCSDPQQLIQVVKALEPTFGGINLEDIKAPECFEIEEILRREMNIPVMHDDQHGTAIISGAALLNALEIVNKKINEVRLVVLGAGAAAISCTRFYLKLGILPENIVMVDKDGVLRKDTIAPDDVRSQFATDRDIYTFEEAIKNADILLGLSVGNIVKPEHLLSMANNPIVFALANPDPEIEYHLAISTRPDVIMATGRSDHPNQVNNVLGFPYIFRGALDVRATTINEEMKLAATQALAQLAKAPVPDAVNQAYGKEDIIFGREYLIPKPLDPRLITVLAPAVAKAAIESGVARKPITDWEQYENELLARIGTGQKLMGQITNRAKLRPKRVILAEADNYKILKAAHIVKEENIATPILLGNKELIAKLIKEHHLDLEDCEIINPLEEHDICEEYGGVLYEKRKRKGMSRYEATKLMRDRNYFGAVMLDLGLADALISGLTKDYPQIVTPALRVIGVEKGVSRVAGMYIINSKKGVYFFADTTVNVNPTADELVDIIGLTARYVHFFNMEPRVAVLSYSNFGSARGESINKCIEVVEKAKAKYPELIIDGEMQANVAVNPELLKEAYPFSELAEKGANTLIFPDLNSGNIAYKLLQEIGEAEAIGPILMGMRKPVHVLQMGSSVREIVNMIAIAVVDAQTEEDHKQVRLATLKKALTK
jgi:malate dehydrogenase (oxaloacetate-decarboxylating)(NADP+)